MVATWAREPCRALLRNGARRAARLREVHHELSEGEEAG